MVVDSPVDILVDGEYISHHRSTAKMDCLYTGSGHVREQPSDREGRYLLRRLIGGRFLRPSHVTWCLVGSRWSIGELRSPQLVGGCRGRNTRKLTKHAPVTIGVRGIHLAGRGWQTKKIRLPIPLYRCRWSCSSFIPLFGKWRQLSSVIHGLCGFGTGTSGIGGRISRSDACRLLQG